MKTPESPKTPQIPPEDKELAISLRKEIIILKKRFDRADKDGDRELQKSLLRKATLITNRIQSLERGEGDITSEILTPEQYLSDLHPFMLETYKDLWLYNEEQLETVEENTSNPDNIHIGEDIPYDDLNKANKSPDPNKAGEIYLSPETPDFENAKVFIPDLSSFNGKPLSEVFQYIKDTYGDTHIIPDIKYMKYLAELGDQHKAETDETKKEEIKNKIPEQLRDGKWYYFPESAFANESGHWFCPNLLWDDDGFYRNGYRLDNAWDDNGCVVLLER